MLDLKVSPTASAQNVAEYAPEILQQLFQEEALFMPRVNYMEPRQCLPIALEARKAASKSWKRKSLFFFLHVSFETLRGV